MWRITHISCENFISFQSVSVDIPQNVCTLVYGINLDNEKQKNNGTGKSSIIEAIAFGLTGEPLRGVDKTEEIINDHSDTAHVRLELQNDYDDSYLTIDRTLSRKIPQQIECHKYDADHVEIDTDKTIQPSVLEYNRYILSEIGLTKDDIYSNFILSDTHYKSFFDANDKTKKAMINRFSGADAVDKAIEKLQDDKQPVQDRFEKAKEAKISIDSKIEVVEQQLKEVDEKKEEYAREKSEHIQRLRNKIADARDEERENKEQINKANKRLDDIGDAGDSIEDMQDKDYDLSTAYTKVSGLLELYRLPKIKDYLSMSKDAETEINRISLEIKDKEKSLKPLGESLETAQKKVDDIKKKVDKFEVDSKKADDNAMLDLKDIQYDIEKNDKLLEKQWTELRNLQDTSDRLDKAIRDAKNQLHGAIVCPKCKHEFFLNENVSVKEVKENLKVYEEKLAVNKNDIEKADKAYDRLKTAKDSLKKEKEAVNKEISDRSDQLYELRRDLDHASQSLGSVTTEIGCIKRNIASLQSDIDMQQAKIDGMLKNMLQEALDIIDNTLDKGERYVKTLEEKNVSIEASIEAYEKSIKEAENSSQSDFIASLNKSLAEYKTEQSDAAERLSEAQKEVDRYTIQENNFIEFRSYLANKKVEAIAGVTNYFLELIGSDLRVEMLGYKKLKSGKIRDKITVNVLKNGVLNGSFFKCSGGERVRINLASILGLQRITNNSTENGKGLAILAADEILDKSDTSGIEAISQALNRLKITSLVVTQNSIVNNDGATIVITKQNGYSHAECK